MPGDALSGLFKRRREIALPGGEAEQHARKLARMGLVRIEEREFVRCVNPLDHDQQYLKDSMCTGRVVLSAKKPVDEQHQCSDCGRVIFPRRKQQARVLRIVPDNDAMTAFVRTELDKLHQEVREQPQGLFRMPTNAGEVQVCLVDLCGDRQVFDRNYPYRGSLLFVLGNDRDFRRNVPANGRTFRLAEMALGEAKPVFRREVRTLLGNANGSAKPAVLDVVESPGPVIPTSNVKPETDATPSPFRCPPGTRWNQVEMYHADSTTLALRIPDKRLRRYTHQHFGLALKRNGLPTKGWELLAELCEKEGVMPWTGTPREFGAFKQKVSDLRGHLQRLFGIDADPFSECSRSNGLRTAFRASSKLPSDEPYVGERDW